MKDNELSTVSNPLGILKDPGDEMLGRVTDSGRKVLKVKTNNGRSKYSATQYPNGTVVETKTTKMI